MPSHLHKLLVSTLNFYLPLHRNNMHTKIQDSGNDLPVWWCSATPCATTLNVHSVLLNRLLPNWISDFYFMYGCVCWWCGRVWESMYGVRHRHREIPARLMSTKRSISPRPLHIDQFSSGHPPYHALSCLQIIPLKPAGVYPVVHSLPTDYLHPQIMITVITN